MLGAVDPIAQIGIALCLAYIALPEFRYRRDVRDEARSRFPENENAPSDSAALDRYNGVRCLAEWDTTCRSEHLEQTPSYRSYRWWFRSRADVYTVVGCCLVLVTMIVFGILEGVGVVGSALGQSGKVEGWGDVLVALAYVVFTLLLCCAPVLLVLKGRSCRRVLLSYIAQARSSPEQTKQAKASIATQLAEERRNLPGSRR